MTKDMNTLKAADIVVLPTEIDQLIENHNLEMIVALFYIIYSSGIIPNEWLLATVIQLKSQTLSNAPHQPHGLKMLKIFKKIAQIKFGFRNGLGSRQALFALNVVIQLCLNVNCDIFVCCLDKKKDFDTLQHNILM